ncbi:acyltransferase family protein [Flavobacterium sp. HJJ]|uniref:acyltransferase family protein n=1 Tax=Flavobacterium sp. HJJ TaxID=2783792 RepID=UPI00188C69FF|nr:acyltransferase [Flavobacterium sp. HJJ]MBF4470294.1 acyltransferase [Flavobacterium sp. HJJ]
MNKVIINVYFPNLNGIRFLAALLVIIHHTEQIKNLLGLNSKWDNPFVKLIGPLGVILFFVLSGFLITYLLLVEENQTKTIRVKSFYMRRILRIWPLYYLIVGLSFFLFSRVSFFNIEELSGHIFDNVALKLIMFILFLPNLALILFSPVPYASQTWSVGVEEQFYLIWPILMKNVKNKKILLYTIVFGYLVIKWFGFRFIQKFIFWNAYMETVKSFFNSFSIDCMAIGGLFAVYLFNKDKMLKILFSKYTQIITYILLAVLITKGIQIPYIHFEFYAIFFGVMILNLASNEHSLLKLENKLFHYLGKISYGLYMYHPIAIVLTLKILETLRIVNFEIQYILIALVTIVIAGFSYKYFESYFIGKKIKFSKIISGDNANL